MNAATEKRQQCEKDLLASLGRFRSAARMEARGEINEPLVERHKDYFRGIMQRLVEAAQQEGIESACCILRDADDSKHGDGIVKDGTGAAQVVEDMLL